MVIWALVLLITASAVGIFLRLLPKDEQGVTSLIDETIHIEFETEPQSEWVNAVPKPEVDVQHLTMNEFSRPGEKTKKIQYIVIHYLGNPGTTAQENHDYFESLKGNIDNVSMSANYVIGLEGEIIECVPPGEIAYASNQINDCSISIENCHLEETGRFTVETYQACVQLTAWLVNEYGLERESIIRHYDVTGKQCPLYYVQNPDKWETFRDDVMAYIETCEKEYIESQTEPETETETPLQAESELQSETQQQSETQLPSESTEEAKKHEPETEQSKVGTEAVTEAAPEPQKFVQDQTEHEEEEIEKQ